MRILVATDAWHPAGQRRGAHLRAARARSAGAGRRDRLSSRPPSFRSIPCPAYPSIRLAIPNRKRAGELIEAAGADFIHVATEGPVGLMARSFCLRGNRPFTTSYHTKFPEYAVRPAVHSAELVLRAAAPFPQRRRRHDGGDAVAARRAAPARLHAPDAVDARGRYRSLSSPRTTACSARIDRCSCMSGASPRRRTSRRSWRPTCPG